MVSCPIHFSPSPYCGGLGAWTGASSLLNGKWYNLLFVGVDKLVFLVGVMLSTTHDLRRPPFLKLSLGSVTWMRSSKANSHKRGLFSSCFPTIVLMNKKFTFYCFQWYKKNLKNNTAWKISPVQYFISVH